MLWSDMAVSRSTWSGLSRVSRSVWYPHTGTYLELLIAEISVSRLGLDIGFSLGMNVTLQNGGLRECDVLRGRGVLLWGAGRGDWFAH
jgi:hypothetical protein